MESISFFIFFIFLIKSYFSDTKKIEMSREKGLKYIMSANTPFVDKGYHYDAVFAPHKPHKTRIKLQTYDFSLSNIKVLLVLFSPDKPLIDTK